MGRLFERNGTIVVALTTLLVIVVLLATVAIKDPAVLYAPQRGEGAFFRIIPLWLINLLAISTFGLRWSRWRWAHGATGPARPAAAACPSTPARRRSWT